jgi:four helix bundle protein
MPFKGFRVFELAVAFFRRIKRLKLAPHLRRQLERAASSVALNACEGYGRRSPDDKRHFYQMALGSMRECQAILILIEVKDAELLDQADHLAAALYRLCTRVA